MISDARSHPPRDGDLRSTAVAQPAIVTASLAALNLSQFGIEAEIAVGHSLGELTAFHWAESFDSDTLLRITAARGQAMSDLAGDAGAMASLAADQNEVEALLDGEPVAIAGLNARRQTVVSGPVVAVSVIIACAGSWVSRPCGCRSHMRSTRRWWPGPRPCWPRRSQAGRSGDCGGRWSRP